MPHNLEEAENLKETSQTLKSEYEESLATLKKDKKKTVKIIKDKFDREILEAKAEIKEILDELRREKSEKIARRSYARLAITEQKFKGKLSEFDEKQHYEKIDWSKIKTGDKLILKELHQPVTILSLPDKNENVIVQMGNFKTKIKSDKLAPYDSVYEKKENVYRPSSLEKFELRKTNISNTLDLRGYKVEDALDSLELYLDKASLANLCICHDYPWTRHWCIKISCQRFLINITIRCKIQTRRGCRRRRGVSIVDIN